MANPITKDQVLFTFMSYNICFSRSATDSPKGMFGVYAWEKRSNDVFELLKQKAVSVLFLQEVQCAKQTEITTTLTDYTWHFEPTLARNGVCCNAIGIKKDFMPGVKQEKGVHNFNKGKIPVVAKASDPSAPIPTRDDTKEKVLRVVIGNLCFVNIHWPMNEEDRLKMAVDLKACIPQDKNYRVIIAGDFNSFPNYKGKEQLEAAEKATGGKTITDQALSEITNKVAASSFTPYPYDPVPAADLATPGKLDHILAIGLKLAKGTQAVVLDKAHVKGQKFAPSDHFPLIATLQNE